MITIRDAMREEVPALLRLARSAGTLDLHTPYTYWTLTAAGIVLLALDDTRPVGLLTALRAADPARAFLWQVGLVPEARGRGIAARLLDTFRDRALAQGIDAVDLTIAADNTASFAMMHRFAQRHGLMLAATGETGDADGAMANETAYTINLA
ncbi:GNAT family N-acetyltransferase [Novosphingobium sp. KCTC 2891]|uniref:GNAT family N-acetyltransferase n=1 Tax=Novosphingobium sp. KCTC 2891 TaxID=2989730 RepID=UPI002221DBAC|nr:GNAT family N-acetyltransferase [Novosphingobium sp. KCTC 2891]MCW1381416.1 GNAT family N-acetyltransferase [Novosphingobium sp. KCTC 2891]